MQIMAPTRSSESGAQKVTYILKRIIRNPKEAGGEDGVCTYRHFFFSNSTGLTETNHKMWRQRTASKSSFLSSAADYWVDPYSGSPSHIASTDAVGAIDLMSR